MYVGLSRSIGIWGDNAPLPQESVCNMEPRLLAIHDPDTHLSQTIYRDTQGYTTVTHPLSGSRIRSVLGRETAPGRILRHTCCRSAAPRTEQTLQRVRDRVRATPAKAGPSEPIRWALLEFWARGGQVARPDSRRAGFTPTHSLRVPAHTWGAIWLHFLFCPYLVPQLSLPESLPLVPTAFIDGPSRVREDAIALGVERRI